MTIPNLLSAWNPAPGQVITEARLEALINRLEVVLTSLDGSTNLAALSVLLGNLATPKGVFQVQQQISRPDEQWLDPIWWFAVPTALGTAYTGAGTQNLTIHRVPMNAKLLGVWCGAPMTNSLVGTATVRLWLSTGGGAFAAIPGTALDATPGTPDFANLAAPVQLLAGDLLAWRAQFADADPRRLPIDVGFWAKADLQVP